MLRINHLSHRQHGMHIVSGGGYGYDSGCCKYDGQDDLGPSGHHSLFLILKKRDPFVFRKYALIGRLKGDSQNGHNQHRDIWCTVIRHTPVRAAASAQQSANVNRYTEPHGRTVKLTLLPSRKNIFR